MDSKMPGLNETEEKETTSPAADSAEPQAVADAETSVDNGAAPESPTADEAPVTEAETASSPVEEGTPVEADSQAAPVPTADVEPVAPASDAASGTSESVAPAAESQAVDTGGLKRGDLVEGTISATSPTAVTVDVGVGRPGVIPGHELERMSRNVLETLQEGATITVYIVNPNDHNGNVVLSLNRALEELDWKQAEEYRQAQQVLDTRVAGYNKGGLIVRFGRLRGFVPQSQMSPERRRTSDGETPEERWGKMVNEPITVKVMEVDRSRNRLILSERMASRETREKRKESLIGELTVGEVRTGRVVSLEDFGAFIDIGGAEGLVHLTELTWKHVTHPREVLQVGQEVSVEVISVDREAKRIGLSLKRQEPDPWDTVAINYNVGQLVQAIVTKLTKFGAFARLVDLPEIEGLIHISELSEKRVTHPREVVEEGDKMTLRVVKMDIKNRRLGLSLKRVNSAEYLDQDWAMAAPDADTEDDDGNND